MRERLRGVAGSMASVVKEEEEVRRGKEEEAELSQDRREDRR